MPVNIETCASRPSRRKQSAKLRISLKCFLTIRHVFIFLRPRLVFSARLI